MPSNIEWTDETWNPVTGCIKVSPGCAHCYAEVVADRFWATQYPPVADPSLKTTDLLIEGDPLRARRFTDVQCHEDRLAIPLKWRKPRLVFVNSMSDLFHKDVPDEFIDRVFAVMALTPQHTYQVLTKRAERMRDYLLKLTGSVERMDDLGADALGIAEALESDALEDIAGTVGEFWPLPNVWLGVSVENQHFADARIPLLLETPAAVRFISAEPLLGPINLTQVRHSLGCESFELHSVLQRDDGFGLNAERNRLDWVIVGGESGPMARPCQIDWLRSIVEQCRTAAVPCFVKQVGSRPDGWWTNKLGPRFDRHALKDKKGGDPEEWPSDLRIRQFPEVRHAV